MPLFFAHAPRPGQKSSSSAISIGSQQYEPTSPGSFKITAFPYLTSALGKLVYSYIGLVMAVLSWPPFSYIPFTAIGAVGKKTPTPLPFRGIGHAFALKRNVTLGSDTENDLLARGYSTMNFGNRTIYLKENADADDYKWVNANIDHFDEKLQLPNRYLSHANFLGYLQLLSITSTIAAGLMFFAHNGTEEKWTSSSDSDMKVKGTYSVAEQDIEGKKPPSTLATFPEFETPSLSDSSSGWVKFISRLIGSSSGLGTHKPGAVLNYGLKETVPFVESSSAASTIGTHGLVCPFRFDLSLPDSTLIGDVLARHFRTLLGDSPDDQATLLQSLRSTVGNLKLTRLGDELAHIYKCFDLAVDSQCGVVLFFSGTTYDGAFVGGGTGAHLLIGDRVLNFEPLANVTHELGTISVHATALREISELFPTSARTGVLAVRDMVALRTLCLANAFTTDNMSKILGIARGLDFGNTHWVASPDSLKKCFNLISGSTPLTKDIPISREALFSKDMLVVGLSVFGENEVPSWNIPSGALRKLTGKAPPSAPSNLNDKKYRLASGGTDDGAWVMEVRGTKLETAVDEFRFLTQQGGYRSIPSSLAKRQKYRVFQGQRMGVFWSEMQKAYSAVNSSFKAEDRDDSATIGKRSPGSAQGGSPPQRKKQKVDI